MQIFLPIADVPVDLFVLLILGAAVGFLSGVFGIGGGFLMTPLLILLGIPAAVAVATEANQIAASSFSGVLAHLKRRAVDFKMGNILVVGGLLDCRHARVGEDAGHGEKTTGSGLRNCIENAPEIIGHALNLIKPGFERFPQLCSKPVDCVQGLNSFVADVDYIIWDDPFSSVDLILESQILNKIKKITKTPIVAIGGINSANYKKLLLNNANFLAISSYIWNNKKLKPEEAIKRLK